MLIKNILFFEVIGRGIKMLNIKNTAIVLVDYQGKLARIMDDNKELHEKIKTLIEGVKILEVPVVWLEQYPKGLGTTEEEVKALLSENNEPIAKMDFSGYRNSDFKVALEELNKEHIIVAGIEAHVCVYQTVKDLLQTGRKVEYVEDAISSRTKENKQIAVSKMNLLGALPTSVEMLLFELMSTAEHPNFKEISRLIK